MIFTDTLELYFLEDRDYVNGLTLFEESMKSVCGFLKIDTLSKILIEQFKVIRFVRTHAKFEFYQLEDDVQRNRIQEASALLDLNIGNVLYRVLLFSEPGERNPESIPSYDRAKYVKKDVHNSDGGSEAVIHNARDSYELLRGIIEINQRFTVYHAPKMDIAESRYWAYMTGYPMKDPKALPSTIDVNFSLRQVIAQKGRTMIIRSVSVPSLDVDASMDLCFFSRLS